MRRAILAAAAALLLAGAGASPADAATRRACSSGDRFIGKLTAVGVTCPGARRVALSWARSSRCIPDGDGTLAERAERCVVRGFTCVPRAESGGVRVRCRSQGREVRFTDSA